MSVGLMFLVQISVGYVHVRHKFVGLMYVGQSSDGVCWPNVCRPNVCRPNGFRSKVGEPELQLKARITSACQLRLLLLERK
jgi:hypothetical protein